MNRGGALHKQPEVAFEDQTRSWSTRIANTEDPFLARHSNNHSNLQNMSIGHREQKVVGMPVEERRTDGDRSTRLMTATEWLQQRDEHNNLRSAPRGQGPPMLPRKSARDHLSERNRDTTLYDPAQPGIQPQVRVTARSTFDDCSAQGRKRAVLAERQAQFERARQLEMDARMEAELAAEANELLELRSMGIRSVVAAQRGPNDPRSPVQTRAAAKKKAGGAVAPAPTPMEPAPAPQETGAPLAGWGLARETFNPKKPVFIDGKPLSIDLEWITGPLDRKIEGFRGLPPKVRDEEGPGPNQDPWGPVPFAMPASKQKTAARRATPVRASG